MDISKLRKKHKEAKGQPEPKKQEEVSEPERPEEDEFVEEPEAAEEPGAEDFEEEITYAPVKEKVSETKTAALKPRKAVAQASDEAGKDELELVELLTFVLAEEYYAFRVLEVHEVLRPQFVANVPRTVDFIVGVTSLRGTIIPVMDLRKRLRIEGEFRKASNIIILKGAGRGIIGVLVDRTLDVIKVHEYAILHAPSHLADSEAKFIEGITSQKDKFISIINPEELLSFEAMGGKP